MGGGVLNPYLRPSTLACGGAAFRSLAEAALALDG